MRRTYRHIPWIALVALLVAAILRAAAGAGEATPARGPASTPGTASTAIATSTAGTAGSLPESASPGAETTAPRVVRAVVSRNVDGDTLHVKMPDGTDESVRFIGVNTPESTIRHEPYGKQASAFTKSRLPVGTVLWLEFDVGLRDKYGRILAYLWVRPPTSGDAADVRANMFNATLLLDGYAQLMTIPPDVKYVDVFRPLQAEARNASRGLWGLNP